jgi:hypothetical protein
MASVILGIAGGTLTFTQGRRERALPALLISALALRSAQALPLANAAITPLLDCRFQAYGERLWPIEARLGGLALAHSPSRNSALGGRVPAPATRLCVSGRRFGFFRRDNAAVRR